DQSVSITKYQTETTTNFDLSVVRVNLIAGDNISITGSYPDLTISSTGGGVGSVNIMSGGGMNFPSITNTGTVVLGTPSDITLNSRNVVNATAHSHKCSPGGTEA